MEHKAQKQIVPHAGTAVLFIHGIAGTPHHFRALTERLPQVVSFHNILLDGHGRDAQAFGKSSMRIWEEQICRAVEELARTHEQVFIVAHSMGTLFAIEQAIRHPKVKKLFLLAVPIQLSLKMRMFVTSCKLYLGHVDPADKLTCAARDRCGITLSKNPLHYIRWIPRYLELFQKIRQTRKILGDLHTPCITLQSQVDEMVSPRSIAILRKHSSMEVRVLKASSHYFYDAEDFALLLRAFDDWLKD